MKLSSVNVIVISGGSLLSIHAFSNDAEGIAEAEALFTVLANAHGADKQEEPMDNLLNDGYFNNDGYELFISHAISEQS